MSQQVTGGIFVLWIFSPGTVGENWCFTRMEARFFQDLLERIRSRGDFGGVERCRYRKFLISDASLIEDSYRIRDGRLGSGQNRLLGCISICDYQSRTVIEDESFQLFDGQSDGEHRPCIGSSCARHQTTAEVSQLVEVGLPDAARGGQRGQFSEGMAAEHVSLDAELTQYPVQAQTYRTDGRLCHIGTSQSFFLSPFFLIPASRRPDLAGESRFSLFVPESALGIVDHLHHLGEATASCAQHVDSLGTLSREDDCQ